MARIDLSGLEGPSLQPGEPAQAPLSAFEEDPNQPRTEFDGPDFDALIEDVRQRGILQPIVVTKTANGALRIRFGARRYRAAQRLDLASMPYVLASDARQLDDYAQVSENEKRSNLQPMELAEFVKRKVDAGEAKQAIASKIGVPNATITFLLSMVDMPPVLREAYDTRKCRSPRLFYELRSLHDKSPDLVERAVKDADEVTGPLVSELSARVKGQTAATSGTDAAPPVAEAAPGGELNRPQDGALQPLGNGGGAADAPGAAPISTAPSANDSAPSGNGLKTTSVERKPAAAVPSPRSSWSRPALRATYRRKPVVLLLDLKPSKRGAVHVRRVSGGAQEEAMFDQLTNLHLVDEAAG
jgi:ParB family transcriptional regulator, chromosome partitioning protein